MKETTTTMKNVRQAGLVKKKNRIPVPSIITNSRITLRRYEEGDGAAIYSLINFNRQRLIESFPKSVSFITDAERGELFVRKNILQWRARKSFYFGVWDNVSRKYMGQIFLRNLNWNIPRAEMGYYIDQMYEGKGFMKEAIRSMIIFGFEHLRLRKLCVRISTSNARSSKLAEDCGFVKEGLLRNDFLKADGTLSDAIYYGLTTDDYQIVKTNINRKNITFQSRKDIFDNELRAILQSKSY